MFEQALYRNMHQRRALPSRSYNGRRNYTRRGPHALGRAEQGFRDFGTGAAVDEQPAPDALQTRCEASMHDSRDVASDSREGSARAGARSFSAVLQF